MSGRGQGEALPLYGGGVTVATEREVVQGEVPAARSVVEVRVAQVRHSSLYGGGGAVAVEREVVQDQVPAKCTVVASGVAGSAATGRWE